VHHLPIGVASLDPATGQARWWLSSVDDGIGIGDAVQVDDLIVVEAVEGLVAIEPATAEVIWRSDPVQFPRVVASAAGSVMVIEHGDEEDELIVIDLTNGDSLWQTAIDGFDDGWIAVDDRTLVGAFSRRPRASSVTLVGYDTGSGAERWRTSIDAPRSGLESAVLIAGVEGSIQVQVTGEDSELAIVDVNASTGEVRWRVDNLRRRGYDPIDTSLRDVSLVRTRDPIVLVPPLNTTGWDVLIAPDAVTGQERWRSSAIQRPLLADATAIYGLLTLNDGPGDLGALDPATGALLWSGAVAEADDLQGLSVRSVGSADGKAIVTLDSATGSVGAKPRAVAVVVDPADGDLTWRADYREFEEVSFEAAGAGAAYVFGRAGSDATLLALDTD
jgi:outer membrane protein assembly factor BamB